MSDPNGGAESAPVAVTPEPVTPEPLRPLRRTLLHQSWLDVAFVHWAVDPASVGGLLPRGVRPDVYEGATYVGLIALRMHRVGWLALPGVPYFGNFPETNVRLYSVDERGRRGVVFRSFEASRLLPVLIARLGFRLPYMWAEMSVHRRGDGVDYATRRRWPRAEGSGGAHARLGLRIGERIAEPSGLEDFLTARWGMHSDRHGKTLYLPNVHPRWRLHRAELLHLDENLITAAGLPAPAAPPVSVLFSPGVPVRFGAPA
ncbi:YqjF family protein [Streptomyces sp. NPDC059355]|uniref:YqjF family protein n=1 Tax=Streptomyces sp. NPDC059355 TaxID=3346811 RepID=UPI00368BE9B3